VLSDGRGVPLGVAVDGANRHDKTLLAKTIHSAPIEYPMPAVAPNICLDKGYDFDDIREMLEQFGFTAHVRGRGEEAKALKREAGHRARRWVVERTHSWMNRFRRILIRWEKKPENYCAMLHFVCAIITFRATGLFG
jgi:putative transposase